MSKDDENFANLRHLHEEMTRPMAENESVSSSESALNHQEKRRHFSLIRNFTLADFITLATMLAVMYYLVSADTRYLWLAFVLLPFALLFDYTDGRVARWRRKSSPYGEQLDSLADLISFGVAPAAIGFGVGMRGGWDILVLIFFVSCGVGRLARFNATCAELADESGKVRYFEGTPIPTSLLVVTILAVFAAKDQTLADLPLGGYSLGPFDFHPLVLMYAVSGSAMISTTLRVPKF